MYCNKCRRLIINKDTYCEYCGAKVKQPNSISDDMIIEACKACIKKHLKSPSSAIFETVELIDEDAYGRYFLYAEVDSQNSFGAMIRTNLRIVLQKVYNDGTYSVLETGVCPVNLINTEEAVKRINRWDKSI